MIFNNAKNRRGQLLIETLVALGILTTGFLGILGLLSRSLSLNRVVSEQYQANYLAAEGIEIVKNAVDQNLELPQGVFNNNLSVHDCFEVVYDKIINSGLNSNLKSSGVIEGAACPPPDWSTNPDYRLYVHPDGFYDYNYSAGSAITPFTRFIEVSPSTDGNKIVIDSYVEWISRGGGQFEVHLEDTFYNWRQYAK